MPGILGGLLNGRSYIRKGEEGGMGGGGRLFKIRYIFSSTDQNTFLNLLAFLSLKTS